MTNAELFSKAHAMTRATIKDGDNYAVTFGAAIRAIRQAQKTPQPKLYVGEFIINSLSVVLLCILLATFATASLALFGAMFAGIVGAYIGAASGVMLAIWQGAVMVVDEYQCAIHTY